MSIALHIGDCRAVLATLPSASVHCVVTSPPYWGLRDYGTATWEGGEPGCEHTGVARRCDLPGRNDKQSTQRGSSSDRVSRDCLYCGATRIDAQLGLEPDFNAYVANMVAVFREVRRVLRDDGTLWLNLGDSYASQGGYRDYGSHDNYVGRGPTGGQRPAPSNGLKPKDLCGIPWRVAFALQADGWYLRQDIIWSKPNPMPESVTDRCTKSHEYLFLLSKRERYYYDAEAIAEPVMISTIERLSQPTLYQQEGSRRVPGKTNGPMKAKLPRGKALSSPRQDGNQWNENNGRGFFPNADLTRNKRSVWEVTTQPFSEAHFATFPPALIEPCIKAGCPVGGTVLDPFGGAGTTGLVADRLQRNAILIELNPAYAAMGENRIKDDAPLFVEMVT